MRDIQEIIDELMAHPHYIASEIFTLDDVINDLNEQLCNEVEDFEPAPEIKYEDLTADDLTYIHAYVDEFLFNIYDNCDGGPNPYLNQMPDLYTKVKRDILLSKVLKK